MTGGAAIPIERSRYADFVALTKPRLNLLVIATAAAGFYLGARNGSTTRGSSTRWRWRHS